MGGLLGGGEPGDPAGGPEDLRAIVAKAGRRMRIRAGALAGAVAIVAGSGVGYAVSTTGGSTPQVVATSQRAGGRASSQAPGGAASAAGPSASIAFPGAAKFSRLFTRQANGVDIRAFLVAFPMMTPLGAGSAAAPSCTATRFQAELSTPAMVAIAGGGGFVGQQAGAAVINADPEIVGEAEGDPVAVVVVQTDPTVSKVRMSFNGGATDEMTPREGWSVLAAPASWFQPGKAATTTKLGTLTALGSGGRTVGSRTLTWPPTPTPAPGVVPGSGGSTGSGSGTAGGGSAGSGTVSSGTASSGTAGSGSVSAPVVTAVPSVANPCRVPPPCGGYPNGASCPEPAPMPAVTAPDKAPSGSATTPATGSGG